MSELDLNELESIMSGVLNKEEEPPEIEVEAGPVKYLEDTDWSDYSDFEGVAYREVDARKLFSNDKLPAVHIKQFRGFTNSLPVPDIYIPHLASLATIIKSEVTGLKAILVGDTGCGKTSVLEYYAAMTGRPFFRIAWDESTDDQKLFGSLEVRSGEDGVETYFNPAPTTISMKYPAICVQDELSRGNSSQTMLLNEMLDRGTVTVTSHDGDASHQVVANPDWLIFATDNTCGNGDDIDVYNAANILDQAIINRFDLYQRVPYAPPEVESMLINKFTDGNMPKPDRDKLARFSQLCHKGFSDRTLSTAFSVRNLQAICKLFSLGDTVQKAVNVNYISRVAKSEQPDVTEMVRSIWG